MQEINVSNRQYSTATNADGKVEVNGVAYDLDIKSLGNGHYHMLKDGKSYRIEVVDNDDQQPIILVNGTRYQPLIKSETDLLLERLGMNAKSKKEVKELKAPMPGLVLEFRVHPGQEVKQGDPLVVLEAMKMENILKAPVDATIKSLHSAAGQAIEKNTLLISFE